MNFVKAAIALTLILTPLLASAEEFVTPIIPDEATKVRALKRAYQLNGYSMVGKSGSSIDLSKEDLSDPLAPEWAKVQPPRSTTKIAK